eukprot:PhM_4_TR2553/c0_g1_i1/m.2960
MQRCDILLLALTTIALFAHHTAEANNNNNNVSNVVDDICLIFGCDNATQICCSWQPSGMPTRRAYCCPSGNTCGPKGSCDDGRYAHKSSLTIALSVLGFVFVVIVCVVVGAVYKKWQKRERLRRGKELQDESEMAGRRGEQQQPPPVRQAFSNITPEKACPTPP